MWNRPSDHVMRSEAMFHSQLPICATRSASARRWRLSCSSRSMVTRSVTSRMIVQVRCWPRSSRKTSVLISASIATPSPRIIRATPRTSPVRSRSTSIACHRGSVASTNRWRPRAQISASVLAKIRHAAGLAANTWPSGTVNKTPSGLCSYNARYACGPRISSDAGRSAFTGSVTGWRRSCDASLALGRVVTIPPRSCTSRSCAGECRET
jgi:hypothetical protein